MKAHTVVGRREKSLLSDPGSEPWLERRLGRDIWINIQVYHKKINKYWMRNTYFEVVYYTYQQRSLQR